MRWWCVVALSSFGCAVVSPPPPPPPADPSATELACAQSLRAKVQLLDGEAMRACRSDFDCREVSPLVAGKCGAFVNTAAFSAVREEFSRAAVCREVTLVVPRCPTSRPVCVAGQCAGEGVSEIEDECVTQTEALLGAARAANVCDRDEACVAVTEKQATSRAFFEQALPQRLSKAKACGDTPTHLYAAYDEPNQVFCVEGHCQTEKQFTTTVRARDLDFTHHQHPRFGSCLMDAVSESISDASLLPSRFKLQFRATIDTEGRLNEFEFLQNIPPQFQAGLAARIRQCPAGKVVHRGKPVNMRWAFTFIRED